jgi:hypothetical protein
MQAQPKILSTKKHKIYGVNLKAVPKGAEGEANEVK